MMIVKVWYETCKIKDTFAFLFYNTQYFSGISSIFLASGFAASQAAFTTAVACPEELPKPNDQGKGGKNEISIYVSYISSLRVFLPRDGWIPWYGNSGIGDSGPSADGKYLGSGWRVYPDGERRASRGRFRHQESE
jgi:hypothetical protein